MRDKFLYRIMWGSFLLVLGGCSIDSSDNIPSPQRTKPVPRSADTINTTRPAVSVSKASSNPKPARVVKTYKPQVKRYNEAKPVARVLTKEEQAAFNKAMIQLEKKRREVDDPYASIPDNSSGSNSVSSPKKSDSSAVDSLLLQARAEMMVGKYLTAESKIERGLRIDPENPQLWTLLARTHYGQSNYSQAINMAKKAIQFSRDDELTARNWRLIKKAGEKSGDTFAVKEANDYIKINP